MTATISGSPSTSRAPGARNTTSSGTASSGLNLFPAAALRKEMDFYQTKQNAYGLPLDNRKDYTKLDWTLWTATLTQDRGGLRRACWTRSIASSTKRPTACR